MSRVLIVEDEIITAVSLQFELQREGYDCVDIATSEREAIKLFNSKRFDIILMDINLEEGGSGINAAKVISTIRKVPIVFLTAYANNAIIEEAATTFPYGYVVKPYDIREIKAVIATALSRFEQDQIIAKSEAKLRVAIDAARMGVMEIHRYDKWLKFESAEALKQALRINDAISLEQFFQLISDEDRKWLEDVIESARLSNKVIRLRTSDILNPQFLEVFFSGRLFDGEQTIIGAVRDVTEQERHLHEMELSDYIFANMQESVLLLGLDSRIVKGNPALCLATGYTDVELKNLSFFCLIGQERLDDPTQLNDIINRREISIVRKDGSRFFALIAARRIELESIAVNYVVMLTDISEIKKATDRLEEMAYSDSLTQLYNRTFLNNVLREPSNYFPGGHFAVIFIDLDLFKLINDTYGHMAGDQVLKEFSRRIIKLFRSTDFVIRQGGDEFVVLLEGEQTEERISAIVDNIHDVLRLPFDIGDEQITLTCSIGISLGADSSDADVLLQQADMAMYEAKNSGRNNHRIYDEKYGQDVKYQLFLEQGLRQAIEKETLTVWYQPVVDARSNIVGLEALCRWYDDVAGFVPPIDFISAAERSWLIMPLGMLVFKQACQLAQQIANANVLIDKINVNLSPKQVAVPRLPEMFHKVLNEYAVPASMFTFEITENVLQETESLRTLNELRAMGFTIALDDFGTGYSNFAQLKAFPIDIIKLDKSLVQGRFVDNDQRIVCDAVLGMCAQLGFTIVVEGIETEEQAHHFAKHADVLQQGYYHGRPQSDILRVLNVT